MELMEVEQTVQQSKELLKGKVFEKSVLLFYVFCLVIIVKQVIKRLVSKNKLRFHFSLLHHPAHPSLSRLRY